MRSHALGNPAPQDLRNTGTQFAAEFVQGAQPEILNDRRKP